MSRKIYFLSAILVIGIILTSYQMAYSVFTDNSLSDDNTFTAAAEFPISAPVNPSPSPSPSPVIETIVINEVFPVNSDSFGEWVELFNKSDSPVNVSGWKIEDSASSDTFPTSSPIPAGGYAVIVANSTTVTGIPLGAITITLSSAIGNGLNNGGDKLVLKNSLDVIIDQMSFGDNNTVFNPAPLLPSVDTSLSRIPNGVDLNIAGDWQTSITETKGVTN